MTNNTNRNNRTYISGNNAVQLESRALPKKPEQRPEPRVRQRPEQAKGQRSNPVYTLILTFVIITTLAITVVLLKTQFIVTDNAQKLITLQQQLVELKKTNDQMESELQKSVNMDEVYRIATEELGMVQAGKDNVKYIDAKDTTYTVQYADVDVADESTGFDLGSILGFISKGW